MFRRLLLRLQRELYLMLKNTFTLSTDLKIYYTWVYNIIYGYLKSHIWFKMPVPVAARSKAQVCGRSPAEIVGSNPTGGMVVCLL